MKNGLYSTRKPAATKRRKTTRNRKRKYTPNPNLEAIIKKTVSRQMNKKLEKKHIAYSIVKETNIFQYDYSTSSTMYNIVDLEDIWTQITQSASQSGRIGNKITLTNAWIRFTLKTKLSGWSIRGENPINTYPIQPILCRTIIFRRLDGSFESGLGLSKFFQYGSTAIAPTTEITDMHGMINRDIYQVAYDKVHKLVPAVNVTPVDTSVAGTTYVTNQIANNDALPTVTRFKSLVKHMPKTLKYNDTDLSPSNQTNLNWQLVVLPAGRIYTGAIYDVGGTGTVPLPVSITVDMFASYTDA